MWPIVVVSQSDVPFAMCQIESKVEVASRAPMGRSDAPLVLVAEDDDDSRMSATRVLQHAGFRVIEATCGDDVMVLAREQQPAVILMDVSMPGMDGWTTTERLKADAVTAHILILIMTARLFEGDRAIAEKVGSDGFLTKPVSPSRLIRAVNEALVPPPLVDE